MALSKNVEYNFIVVWLRSNHLLNIKFLLSFSFIYAFFMFTLIYIDKRLSKKSTPSKKPGKVLLPNVNIDISIDRSSRKKSKDVSK